MRLACFANAWPIMDLLLENKTSFKMYYSAQIP